VHGRLRVRVSWMRKLLGLGLVNTSHSAVSLLYVSYAKSGSALSD